MVKNYPGIGIIGHEHISALYGVNNGIVDWQGTGIQHFFYESFEQDLIHSATTYIHHLPINQIELGNRLITREKHPIHQHPAAASVEEGFCYSTTFNSQVHEGLSWTERTYATHQNQIVFETTFRNEGAADLSFIAGGYVILRNPDFKHISSEGEEVTWVNGQTKLGITGEQLDEIRLYKESPTGFVYRTLQLTMEDKESDGIKDFTKDTMIGVVTRKCIKVLPQEEQTVRWLISASSATSKAASRNQLKWGKLLEEAKDDWGKWIRSGSINIDQLTKDIREAVQTNLIAMKASLIDGFVPADMTGHYYSNGSPSYYARDSLMIAKAFLQAGYFPEAKSIIMYVASRKTKAGSGEFFQRYNAIGEPSEGANNNVFHQLDSQGYFLSLIEKYFEKTNEWIVPYEQVQRTANVLLHVKRKGGLLGPEGGVNEGVFGPAFITSTNMFLVGGLLSASRIAAYHQDQEHEAKWKELADSINEHIEKNVWIEELNRYGYGYVLYADELVKKYDTPQYFGPLYGYPVTENFKKMVDTSLENQSFYGYGIGYSEQEYHHGPWIFNTAANAQCQVLAGNKENYLQIIKWLLEHSNEYGLLPEAIDGNSEQSCFINPLTWACAEFISAIACGQEILLNPKPVQLKG